VSSIATSRAPLSYREHLKKTAEFYDTEPPCSSWASRQYRRCLGHYYRLLIPPEASVLEVGCGGGELLALLPNRSLTGIDVSRRQIERARARVPGGRFFVAAGEEFSAAGEFDCIILSDVIGITADVQQLFSNLKRVSHRRTRLVINYHNLLWRPLISLAGALKLKSRQPATSWFGRHDVRNLLWLAGWTLIQEQARIICPLALFGLGKWLNRLVSPLLAPFCLAVFCVARRNGEPAAAAPTVSVIVPARNEAGNIGAAVERIPQLGAATEIIFIEGHSRDHTWDEIERVRRTHPHRAIRALRQTGAGKGNAVREAFDAATGDILIILDADLTVPPEELPKFCEVLASGKGEFVNGVRLVYPIEERAMRFFNLCANKAFGVLFSWILGQPTKDTLCGTKALFRSDYAHIAANRSYFGEFDPFGDFDLLFGAGRLSLHIVDVPIRYRDRSYGATNINRWRHGVLLLRMLIIGASKLRFV